eukprot:8951209-Alexandrium_andersonii.AAC.1
MSESSLEPYLDIKGPSSLGVSPLGARCRLQLAVGTAAPCHAMCGLVNPVLGNEILVIGPLWESAESQRKVNGKSAESQRKVSGKSADSQWRVLS